MSGAAGALQRPPSHPSSRAGGRSWRGLAALGALACAAALLAARGSEAFLGLVPCAFCLLERRPYQAGLLLGVAALLAPPRFARWLVVGLAACMAVAVVLAFTHVGVEQHWWPDPLPACTVPKFSGMSAAQRLMAMPARPAKPCEDPDYPIPFLPISMAQMDLGYALAVCTALAIFGGRKRGHAA